MEKQFKTDEELFNTLSSIFVEALRINPEIIKIESKLFPDLGAESIHILDIRFRIEETFGFKINQEHLIKSLGEGLNASQIQEKFTVKSLIDYIKDQMN